MFSDPDGAKILIALLVRDLDGVSKTLGKLTVHLKKGMTNVFTLNMSYGFVSNLGLPFNKVRTNKKILNFYQETMNSQYTITIYTTKLETPVTRNTAIAIKTTSTSTSTTTTITTTSTQTPTTKYT